MSVLNDLKPMDIKAMNMDQLKELASELRSEITDVVMKNGGHLASNLGVVELTIALYYVFDLPHDKVVWDVGHQCYAHKILSGRHDEFKTIRQYKGISGFPKRGESEYDSFDTGHSSTSISAAVGMARARDILGEDYNIVSVIGDGSLGGGMAFEAINDLGAGKEKMIIVLNDNKMSISANVGGISRHLDGLRIRPRYKKLKRGFEGFLRSIPKIGKGLARFFKGVKNRIRLFLLGATIFERMGIMYLGPIDGNNLETMIKVLQRVKEEDSAVVLHIVTQKGKGDKKAEEDPEKYHGVSPTKVGDGIGRSSFTQVFSQALIEQANKDNRIVAITAAMPKGTGLTEFKKSFPNRFYDVGIAEQHAVTLAAGMAVSGLRPVFAVYSTFSQRAYDQILHDVCIQNLPVIFAIDRAGLVGEDGETHQGIFDISILRALPNMHIFAPSNERELKNALELALTINGPCAIRFPKGEVMADRNEPLIHWKWNKVVNGDGCAIIAFGRMLEVAINAAELIKAEGHNVAVYNAGFIKPLDTETLKQIASEYNVVFTLEDSILAGGFGQACAAEVMDSCKIINIGINDSFVAHGAVEQLLAELELDTEGVAKRIRSELK